MTRGRTSHVLTENAETWVILGAGLAFAALGIGVLRAGLRSRRAGLAAASWPRATGEILKSDVEHDEKLVFHQERKRPVVEHRYTPRVTYEYHVGGRRYTSSAITSDDCVYLSRAPAEQVVARYPRGSRCEVRYRPADPAEALLEAGVGPGAMISITGGVFSLIVAVVLMWHGATR